MVKGPGAPRRPRVAPEWRLQQGFHPRRLRVVVRPRLWPSGAAFPPILLLFLNSWRLWVRTRARSAAKPWRLNVGVGGWRWVALGCRYRCPVPVFPLYPVWGCRVITCGCWAGEVWGACVLCVALYGCV